MLYTIFFPGVSCSFTLETYRLNLEVSLWAGSQLIDDTRGLMGTLDGNPDNDLTSRGGHMYYPPTATTVEINQFADSCKFDDAHFVFLSLMTVL